MHVLNSSKNCKFLRGIWEKKVNFFLVLVGGGPMLQCAYLRVPAHNPPAYLLVPAYLRVPAHNPGGGDSTVAGGLHMPRGDEMQDEVKCSLQRKA